jgi:iron complex transport system substrate-binding protein
MRIVSLLPSATEIVYALGLGEQLVGRSHACDYPPEVQSVAAVTVGPPSASTEPTTGSRPIPDQLLPADEVGVARLDVDALRTLAADLILAGDGDLGRAAQAAIATMPDKPRLVALGAASLEGILHSISTIGSMTESEDAAIDLVEELREEVGSIEQRVVVRQDQGVRAQRAVVLQGLRPLLGSGLWVPEQVRRSGGWELLGHEGGPAGPTTWEEIADVDPEMLLFSPAGLTLLQTQALWRTLPRPEIWSEIAAVRRGQVFFVEPVYFNRPGPRIVDGMGMLAEIFDPDAFVDTSPPNGWTPLVEDD